MSENLSFQLVSFVLLLIAAGFLYRVFKEDWVYKKSIICTFLSLVCFSSAVACSFQVIKNEQDVSRQFQAVQSGKIISYSKCYNKGKYKVCEADYGTKYVVNDYWKVK